MLAKKEHTYTYIHQEGHLKNQSNTFTLYTHDGSPPHLPFTLYQLTIYQRYYILNMSEMDEVVMLMPHIESIITFLLSCLLVNTTN